MANNDKSNKSGAAKPVETSEFGATSEATAPAVAATPAAETPKKTKKPRTPIETRLAGMNRGEKAVYYSQHYTSLHKQLDDLKLLVGEEAVKLAESEFLK